MSMETLAAKIDGFGLYDVPSSPRLQNSFLKSVSGSCESPGPCGNLPICRLSLRFAGSTICGTNWRTIRHTWYRYIINRTNHEYLHMQVNRELLSLTEAEANLEKNHRRHGLVRYRRRHRRTYGIGSHLWAGTHSEKGEICCHFGVHDSTIHTECTLGSINCGSCRMEILWCSMWRLGSRRVYHDSTILFPAPESKFWGFDWSANTESDWLCRGTTKHFGNDIVHGR